VGVCMCVCVGGCDYESVNDHLKTYVTKTRTHT